MLREIVEKVTNKAKVWNFTVTGAKADKIVKLKGYVKDSLNELGGDKIDFQIDFGKDTSLSDATEFISKELELSFDNIDAYVE